LSLIGCPARHGRRTLFVAVLGASSLSYAQARWSETLPDWIECHILALEFFGGAPALLVPDNAKVAIIKACHFDPQVNRTYCGMAAHYGSAVLPTRQAAVRIVERWLLGRLRHRIFYSLAEVNAAIGQLLHDLNDKRVLRRVGATRRQLFEELDRPAHSCELVAEENDGRTRTELCTSVTAGALRDITAKRRLGTGVKRQSG
jgi:transposase